MTRRWFSSFILFLAPAAVLAQRQRSAPQAPAEPDEDATDSEPEYTFNPIQAQKELKVGDFYFKKKSYRAAANRYENATKWNPNFADAFLKLGEAREKLELTEQARAAYQKYLELSPPPNKVEEVKKKIAQLQKQKPTSTASTNK